MLLAGFETTATSLTWTLFELALHADVQDRLRQEIHQKEREIKARGDIAFTPNDFEDMPYLTAVLKESLRFNPAAYYIYRQPSKDEVIPLSTPITSPSGKILNEIVVPKNTKITISINGYNRNKAIFGHDSQLFDPDRWLTPGRVNKSVNVGVYGNSITFSGGIRSCIGWRFAVMELQAFLVELVGNFEFSPTPEASMIRREACLVMAPTIEGHVKKTRYLPLLVKKAKRAL
ncbi:Cytochrome P450 monooxygenase 128 [Psilocybe cubensis]|nr:Cytochrome P450 monooxygenase 128 [Psilocybe cubensis]KAH9485607.1 Cytochrome P450 monooxygenase 128 [Psilocybe cubensis]